MKTWTRLGIGVAAIALAVAAGTVTYAMRGDSDDPAGVTRDAAQEERAGDDGSGAGTMAMCAPDVPDCTDMIVLPEGDAARCAEGAEGCGDTPCVGGPAVDCMAPEPCVGGPAVDCMAPEPCVGGPAVDCMAPEPSRVCYTLETDPTITKCEETGCAPAEPSGPATDEPLPTEPETEIAPAPGETGGAIGTGCLGEDPCAISSEMKCLPPDCAVSSDGTITCWAPVPCEAPPVEATPIVVEPDGTVVAEDLTTPAEPCVIDPCFGNDPYAGIPEDCAPQCEPPASPDGSTEPAVPCSAPCDEPDPESAVHPCTEDGGGGSSGSAPSDPGVVDPPSR